MMMCLPGVSRGLGVFELVAKNRAPLNGRCDEDWVEFIQLAGVVDSSCAGFVCM